ncbi:C6 transcription factor [Penicillium waksmanii]|uniref:C6 transcription factor n=1 Tax=Penicillium waksmanii TaxID=69791 RepID=UPI002549399A|nr:C6 transcription factor [Penicillium waksmanii]KAJ5975112.1 C6 transcription factor [Penicillium waksmanii]
MPRCDDSDTRSKLLIDREVSKRAWWFLVRQDWLQIPFNNTYNIHPSQFDTEMPKNCDEDVSKMGLPTDIVEQSKDYYTQGSYTSVLNKGIVYQKEFLAHG